MSGRLLAIALVAAFAGSCVRGEPMPADSVQFASSDDVAPIFGGFPVVFKNLFEEPLRVGYLGEDGFQLVGVVKPGATVTHKIIDPPAASLTVLATDLDGTLVFRGQVALEPGERSTIRLQPRPPVVP
jgi:hypothetical protein